MPPDERWTRIAVIFGEAIELVSSRRAAYLEQACAGEPELRAEVDRLLRLHESAASFLEPPTQAGAIQGERRARVSSGTRIGRYIVERHIASGGMGVVYEARQMSPDRRVALKVIHPAFVSPEALRRLTIESEALARLRHPGIAQLYEAGTHDFGEGAEPFIAMELIEGVSLLEHSATLDVRARVALLAEIAEALQHAHEKGVLHRDLKPANILIDHDDRARMLDFGIARLVDLDGHHALARTVTRTEAGTLLGTIQYMSPEQLRSDTREVDTRSDIYSLGVVAYEVLSGSTPFSGSDSSIVALVQAVSRHSYLPLGQADPALRGDLEWIVMKAMAPERARRYASAKEVADDLRRFLDHAPVLARPPSTLYQWSKFARRNRAVVAGLTATIVALTIGMALYARAASQARAAEQEALDSESAAAAVNEFLTRMLASIDPNRRSDTVDLRELVDRAAAGIEDLWVNKPREQAAVRNEVGTIYYNLGRYTEAEREYRVALELRLAALGESHPATLDAMNNLGQALASLGQRDPAIEMYRRALEGRRKTLGPTHPRTLDTVNNLAVMGTTDEERAAAEDLLRAAVTARTAEGGAPDEGTLIAMGNLATLLRRREAFAEALEWRARAAEGFTALHGEDHRLTAIARGASARALHDMGRLEEADAQFRVALEGLAGSRGGRDHDTGVVSFRHGELLEDMERFSEAAASFALARSIECELRGSSHRTVLRMGVREAENLLRGGETEAARMLFESLVSTFTTALPADDAHLRSARRGLERARERASVPDPGAPLEPETPAGGPRG